MRAVVLVPLFALAAAAAACGGHGAEQFSGPPATPEEAYGSCAFCHRELATAMTVNGGHGGFELSCQSCHQDLKPGFAECGHRSVPLCSDCHREQITHHDPGVATVRQCTICHQPHGSPNILLIRPELPLSGPNNMVTSCTDSGPCAAGLLCAVDPAVCGISYQTEGCAAPVRFTNLEGRADGGFVSASRPGTGLCEVCHTTTRYYRSDGTGEPHFELACYPCHPHPVGFLPE